MLSGWCRSRQVLAFRRNRKAGISPAGQPRAGLAASASRKCASSARAASRSRVAVSSTITVACCHETFPACSAARVSGKDVAKAWDCSNSMPAARSPMASTQPTSAAIAISSAWTGMSGGAADRAESAYLAVASAFNAATRASVREIPARMSRHPSEAAARGSACRGNPLRDSATSARSRAIEASIASKAVATASLPMYSSSKGGVTFCGPPLRANNRTFGTHSRKALQASTA